MRIKGAPDGGQRERLSLSGGRSRRVVSPAGPEGCVGVDVGGRSKGAPLRRVTEEDTAEHVA